MKLVEEISLQGNIFAFETDAKVAVDTYLRTASAALSDNEAKQEVLDDLELSIASHLRDAGYNRDRAVNIEKVNGILEQLGPVDADTPASYQTDTGWKSWFSEPFIPSSTNKVIFGICGAIAERLGIDAIWIRALFVLLVLTTHGFFILLYLAFGILLDMSKDKSPRTLALSTHAQMKAAISQVGWRGTLRNIDTVVRKILQIIVRVLSVVGLIVGVSITTALAITMATRSTDLPLIGTGRSLLDYVFVFSGLGMIIWLFVLLVRTSFFAEHQKWRSIVQIFLWNTPIIILATAFITSALYLAPNFSRWAETHPNNHFLNLHRDDTGQVKYFCLTLDGSCDEPPLPLPLPNKK